MSEVEGSMLVVKLQLCNKPWRGIKPPESRSLQGRHQLYSIQFEPISVVHGQKISVAHSSGREMTSVFSATRQIFRPGLRTSPLGRAALSTLRANLNPARQAKQPLQHLHDKFQAPNALHGSAGPVHCSRPASSPRLIFSGVGSQSRWVSIWKRGQQPKEEESEEDIWVTEEKLNRIFRQRMDPEEAIELLTTLQRHRLAGTLDQKLAYPDSWIGRGLVWLRANHPVDEDAAIIARIDREIESGVTVPQSNVRDSLAVSQFEKRRREIKERDELERQSREAKEKREMQDAGRSSEKRLNVETKKPLPPLSPALVQLKKTGTEWVDKYRDKAEKQAEKEAPDDVVLSMSWMTRLLPSAAVVLSVVGLSILFAQHYSPPSRKARLWPDIPPAAATLITLIGMNVAVFLLWKVPPLWSSMNRKFIVAHVYPHCFSMLGAAFSHQSFSHIFGNMLGLWLIGSRGMSTLVLYCPTLQV